MYSYTIKNTGSVVDSDLDEAKIQTLCNMFIRDVDKELSSIVFDITPENLQTYYEQFGSLNIGMVKRLTDFYLALPASGAHVEKVPRQIFHNAGPMGWKELDDFLHDFGDVPRSFSVGIFSNVLYIRFTDKLFHITDAPLSLRLRFASWAVCHHNQMHVLAGPIYTRTILGRDWLMQYVEENSMASIEFKSPRTFKWEDSVVGRIPLLIEGEEDFDAYVKEFISYRFEKQEQDSNETLS